MKAVLTLIFIIFLGTAAMAQSTAEEVKVETKTATVELNIKIEKSNKLEKEVARLYLFKNLRIIKELKFKTKRNSSKLA
ncbi:hypothetical protein MTsPCn9_01340 [Croceitalea sp. MTPC9]|uniref:hypothetical protein n=1 Tax=unclassified Croceitalea TaxID=2632280 RepID=UPI002B3A4100|nr:hypothetical protein MTsPCn6_07370 [Croceitalea sp. MTPC6]GMN15198.1 hypothetical protein MTsPCn9_01340 [Croceitalea sp. MTPC9]